MPFLPKGDFKVLVLRALGERPMHGYEIIKVMEERGHGFYKPSAGTIYPALRALLREDLVTVSGGPRRKTYKITAKGKASLQKRGAMMEKWWRQFESNVGPERAALFKELRTTGRLLAANMRSVTSRQARELRKLVVKMRTEMMRVISA